MPRRTSGVIGSRRSAARAFVLPQRVRLVGPGRRRTRSCQHAEQRDPRVGCEQLGRRRVQRLGDREPALQCSVSSVLASVWVASRPQQTRDQLRTDRPISDATGGASANQRVHWPRDCTHPTVQTVERAPGARARRPQSGLQGAAQSPLSPREPSGVQHAQQRRSVNSSDWRTGAARRLEPGSSPRFGKAHAALD